jgi:hypothetical protein
MEWWKNDEPLLLNIFATKDSMVGWGRILHEQKKELSSALEATNLCVKQFNVNYQGLTKSPHEILEIVKVKLTHNVNQIWTSSS